MKARLSLNQTEDDRRQLVRQVLSDPPTVHPAAPNGRVWQTQPSCYEWLARHAKPGSRSLETGAGVSTVLFAAWGCDHLAVVHDGSDVVAVRRYCEDRGIDLSGVTFDVRPSEQALPSLDRPDLDLFFIDGGHAYPLPVIDWFYGGAQLRRGGLVIFDDVNLAAVRTLVDGFVERDPRWERIAGTGKWRAYRRHSEGPLAEEESAQSFFADAGRPWTKVWRDRAKRTVKGALRR